MVDNLEDPREIAAGDLDTDVDVLDLLRVLLAHLYPCLVDVDDQTNVLVRDGDSVQSVGLLLQGALLHLEDGLQAGLPVHLSLLCSLHNSSDVGSVVPGSEKYVYDSD